MMCTSVIDMKGFNEDQVGFGNKIKNIAFLAQSGIKTPRGFGLPYDVYSNHIERLMPDLLEARDRANDYSEMAYLMQQIILSASFTDAPMVQAAIDRYMPGASFFAVRSSGSPVIAGNEIAEDSSEMSLAGQYESFLLIPASSVPEAILLCYASLFSERCLSQFKVKNDPSYLLSRMSVLIQEMYQADLSAVVMTRDPVEGGEIFGAEITYGACEALVSGSVQGDLYLLHRESGVVLESYIGTKGTRISYDPHGKDCQSNKKVSALPAELRTRYAASAELVAGIYRLSMAIENLFNTPQDIELVIIENEIIIVQSRPITVCA